MVSKNNKQRLKTYARENRKYGTKGEAILWKYVLKAKKTGYQFNRQFVIDYYIVDFICRKLKLIIEIDGSSHFGQERAVYDKRREDYLKNKGYHVIRFKEFDVVKSLYDVSNEIYNVISSLENELENNNDK